MNERSFDEMIAFFNRRVADMDISQDCKMELLGMVTALGYKHEKSVPQWIPCSERLPEEDGPYLVTYNSGATVNPECDIYDVCCYEISDGWEHTHIVADCTILAWCELPEPWRGES